MPLKLKLAAHERLIVNGAVMVNGGCRTTLVIGNFAHIMREKDVLQERDANTPTRRLYFILQTMLMQPPPSEAVTASYRLAHTQLTVAYERPENLTILGEVDRMVELGDYYKAMMKLQPLIAYEAQLLNVPPQEWRRASQRDPEAARLQGALQPGPAPNRFSASNRAPNTGGSSGYAAAAQ
jgi:flagellar biosynthesis repressor protein FlbT